jgi:hypothetical protein
MPMSVADKAMKVEPDPGRHALLVAIESYNPTVKSRCKALEGTTFGPLKTTCTDAKIMDQVRIHLFPSYHTPS